MRTGYYAQINGYIDIRNANGYWWSSTNNATTGNSGRGLRTYVNNIDPENNNYRGTGFAIRCTIRVE